MDEIGTLGFTIIDLGVGLLILLYAWLLSDGEVTTFLLRTVFFLSLYLAGRAHDMLLRPSGEEPPRQ
jgi:hypothetical protein